MKVKNYNTINQILKLVITTMAIVLVGGMLIEMLKSFSNPNSTYFIDYAKVALTLFGFTLVGAIFEHKNFKNNKIVKRLLHISIVFLSSAISFFYLHAFNYYNPSINNNWLPNFLIIFGNLILLMLGILAMVVAFLGFVYGLLFLLWSLVSYAMKLK